MSRTNMLGDMPTATYGDVTGVRQKSIPEIRQAVATAVAMTNVSELAKSVSHQAERSAETAVGVTDPSTSLVESVADAVQPQAAPADIAMDPQAREPVHDMALEAEDDGPDIGL